jgi:hypothetical protein
VNGQISLECAPSRRPANLNPDRPVRLLELTKSEDWKHPLTLINVRELVLGTDLIEWPADYPKEIIKCTFVNYGPTPVASIGSFPIFSWWESVPGRQLFEGMFKTPLTDLGTTAHQEDSFYISNLSRFPVWVRPPKLAIGRALGDTQFREFQLRDPPNLNSIMFWLPPAPLPTLPRTAGSRAVDILREIHSDTTQEKDGTYMVRKAFEIRMSAPRSSLKIEIIGKDINRAAVDRLDPTLDLGVNWNLGAAGPTERGGFVTINAPIPERILLTVHMQHDSPASIISIFH